MSHGRVLQFSIEFIFGPGLADNDELTTISHVKRHGMIFAIPESICGRPATTALAYRIAVYEGIGGGLIIGHGLSYLLVRQN